MLATRTTTLLRRPASSLRTPASLSAAVGGATGPASQQETFALQRRLKCSKDGSTSSCPSVATTPPSSPMAPSFWASRVLWKRAAINTLRCLVGCTAGDFSAMWYLQLSYPSMGMGTIMAISSAFTLVLPSRVVTLTLYSGFWYYLFDASGDCTPPTWSRPSPLGGRCPDGCGHEHDLDDHNGAGRECS